MAACAEADAACCAVALPVQTMKAAAARDRADRPRRRIRALRRRPVLTMPALMTVSRFPHPPSRNSPALGAHRAPELRLSSEAETIPGSCARQSAEPAATPRLHTCQCVGSLWLQSGRGVARRPQPMGISAANLRFPRLRRSPRCRPRGGSGAESERRRAGRRLPLRSDRRRARRSACDRCGPAATTAAIGGRSRHSRAR
jgi:hypothetical protein